MASSNAGPLIWLGKCNLLDHLKKLYDEIIVPEAVYYETVTQGLEKGFEDAKIIKKTFEEGWLKVYRANKHFKEKVEVMERELNIELGEGEREAIALAIENEITIFLTNDEETYQVGIRLGLEPKGILYVLLRGIKDEHVNKKKAKDCLKQILEEGFWLSPTIIHEFHETLDEL